MTTTDVSVIRSGGRIETDRRDKSSDASNSSEKSARVVADSVQFSSTAQQLAALQEELSSIDSVDMAKVEEIREAISNGSYRVDTQQIAESLLALESEHL